MTTVTRLIYEESGEYAGRITGCTVLAEDLHTEDHEYAGVIVDAMPDMATAYIAEGVVAQRPDNSATLDGNVLSNLPVGSKMTISASSGNKQTYDITEATATLNFTRPGDYTVRISKWPMLDKEFQITI
jgi:hypothetical protein